MSDTTLRLGMNHPVLLFSSSTPGSNTSSIYSVPIRYHTSACSTHCLCSWQMGHRYCCVRVCRVAPFSDSETPWNTTVYAGACNMPTTTSAALEADKHRKVLVSDIGKRYSHNCEGRHRGRWLGAGMLLLEPGRKRNAQQQLETEAGERSRHH